MFCFTQGARRAYDKSVVMYKIQNFFETATGLRNYLEEILVSPKYGYRYVYDT